LRVYRDSLGTIFRFFVFFGRGGRTPSGRADASASVAAEPSTSVTAEPSTSVAAEPDEAANGGQGLRASRHDFGDAHVLTERIPLARGAEL